VHRSQDSRIVILEYEVHGKIFSGGAPYDNRLIPVVTIENSQIVHWRDYMDSLAAWRALNSLMNIKCKLLAMSGGFAGTISQALPPEVLFPILYFNRPFQCLRVGRLFPINVHLVSA
jgi:hypothetical protein